MTAAAPHGLPRARRIKQGRDFTRLRTAGRRLVCGCLILNWMPLAEGSGSRLGVITSRKLGGSVVRSRGRRLLREAFRQHQTEFMQPVDMVLVARPSLARKQFFEVEADFLNALRLARLRKDAA